MGVYDLFLGVLNVNGVVAIPSGNTIKLVPDSNVKSSVFPMMRSGAGGDQIVTRVIWLENTNANDLIPALRPLMPQFAHLSAVGGTNALIVSDRASNIYQLETIIRNLDGTGQNDIEAVTAFAVQPGGRNDRPAGLYDFDRGGQRSERIACPDYCG